jgi:hypothetical protein
MDLKRAWRNGFLAPLLLAVPLYDLSLGEISNLISNGNTQKPSAPYAAEASIGADIVAKRDSLADENRLMIPEHAMNSMLFGNGGSAIDDSSQPILQFDPKDIFDSAEGPGDGFQEQTEDIPLIADARLGPGTPLSIAFAAPMGGLGNHSPQSAALFTAGGTSASSAEDTAGTLLSEPPVSESPADEQSENGSPQSVPEPSSLVLLAIGTIALAFLVQRKAKVPTTRT